MLKLTVPALAALAMLAACGGDKPDEARPADTAAPAAQPGAAAAPLDTAPSRHDFEPIDPATGTMVLNVAGDKPGRWTFKDVNGSMSEQPGGGETRIVLQLEGHEDPVHLRLRLMEADEIGVGRFTIGHNDKGLDATYENGGVYFKSVGGANGSVSLTKITTDRAVGSYDMTLESLEEKPQKVEVSGTFDLRVQR
jgi:hypothetical protein